MKSKVVVGMSGGVDSSLTAALLVEWGYDVTGVFLECWRAPGCRVDEDRKDAMDVALQLEIPFKVLDFKKEYKQKVVEYFYNEYQAGRTPNPDTMCNKEIKFGLFYDWAMKEGFDAVATGHYARIEDEKLFAGLDRKKDQSYFLYLLNKEQLEHVLFPLGEMTKDEVRREAKKRKLVVAGKPDSQGICFIGPVDVRKFLEERITPKRGKVVNVDGEEMGEHDGVWFYTIGQRHGFTISGKYKKKHNNDLPALYVVDKRIKENVLVVGNEKEALREEFGVNDIHLINQESNLFSGNVKVRIRHGGEYLKVRIEKENEGVRVMLDDPQRGVASGQAVVFYKGEQVLGGGIIGKD